MNLDEIRNDLKDVRYYYTRKKAFDEAGREVGACKVVEKVRRYNEMVRGASPQLYDVYNGLYIRNLTQEGFSIELCYTPEYVQMLNKRLLLFLQKEISKGGYAR